MQCSDCVVYDTVRSRFGDWGEDCIEGGHPYAARDTPEVIPWANRIKNQVVQHENPDIDPLRNVSNVTVQQIGIDTGNRRMPPLTAMPLLFQTAYYASLAIFSLY
jgi:hypothetical protein